MLRRLLLGQYRREEKENKREIRDNENCVPEKVVNNLPAKEDLVTSDSDSESECSDTEESDTDTISSPTDSFEECSGDILEWKGFEIMRDESIRKDTSNSNPGRNGAKQNREATNVTLKSKKATIDQENPFAGIFDIEESKVAQNLDKTDGQIDKNDPNNNNISNNNSNTKEDDIKNSNNENCNKSGNNKTPTRQTNGENFEKTSDEMNSTINIAKPKSTSTKLPVPTTNTNRNNVTNKQSNSFEAKTNNKQTKVDNNKPKTTSTANHALPKRNSNSISRNCSSRGNQPAIVGRQGQMSGRSYIPGKSSKTPQSNRTLVDTKGHRSIMKNTTGTRGSPKGRQSNVNSTMVSVSELEKILGVNVNELREVIKKFKSEEKTSATGDNLEKSQDMQGKSRSPGTSETHAGNRNTKDQIEQRNKEGLDNKDDISSDSGVSEPDAQSTDGQPRYITLSTVFKRKKYLESQIKKLEERIVVMGEHKKDVQFLHDFFDLYSDGLEKVERSSAGLPCVANLKSILTCQMREMDEEDFKTKLKGLEELGIPHFPEIKIKVEKLRKRIRHTMEDERKCRSKGVQKLRFEIGKVQGMCEALLDCVYQE